MLPGTGFTPLKPTEASPWSIPSRLLGSLPTKKNIYTTFWVEGKQTGQPETSELAPYLPCEPCVAIAFNGWSLRSSGPFHSIFLPNEMCKEYMEA